MRKLNVTREAARALVAAGTAFAGQQIPCEQFDVSKVLRGKGAVEVACTALEKRFSTSAHKHFFGMRMPAAFAVEIPADLMCAITPGAQFVMYNNASKIQNSVFGKEFMKIALEFLEKPTVQAMFKASGNNMAELKEALKKQEQEKIDLMLGSLKLAVKDGNIEEPDMENIRFCFILRSTQKLDVDAEMKDAMKSPPAGQGSPWNGPGMWTTLKRASRRATHRAKKHATTGPSTPAQPLRNAW